MGRHPCCVCCRLKKGPWTAEEDQVLIKFVEERGSGNWPSVPQTTGLQRCRKSCRLRWTNYLRPDIKRGNIEPAEEDLIIRLHLQLGNRWSLIAEHLPGRNDNEIKNYWNNHIKKKLKRQETDHNANNVQTLDKNKKNNIKNTKIKMGVCGGLDDKLVIGSSSHGGGNELGNDVLALLRTVTSFLEDDDDVHGLDFLNDGKLEKIYEEFSELLKEDASK